MKASTNSTDVSIDLVKENVKIDGILTIPENATSIVLFVHGSGSSRFSPRNQYVARSLTQLNIATLLMDLLTPNEEAIDEETRQFRFDIPLLTRRLLDVTAWIHENQKTHAMTIGYFGSSTGAAAALFAAAQEGTSINAVVSRGGRPDLAIPVIHKVTAPTLLIVGGDDEGVIDLNREAYDLLQPKKRLTIVPGATHLFEELGKLEEVAHLAGAWFKEHL